MARSVRIDLEAAKHIYGACRDGRAPEVWALALLKYALARLDRVPTKARPKRKPLRSTRDHHRPRSPFGRAALNESKRERRAAETADLWKQAMARSGGECECRQCGRVFTEEGDNKPEMDHQASRRVPQTLQNVWMLAAACHRFRQQNRPSERYWLGVFWEHCMRQGYHREAQRVEDRIHVVDVKGALPAAPRTRTNNG